MHFCYHLSLHSIVHCCNCSFTSCLLCIYCVRLYVFSVANATRESPDRAEWKGLTQGADSSVYI